MKQLYIVFDGTPTDSHGKDWNQVGIAPVNPSVDMGEVRYNYNSFHYNASLKYLDTSTMISPWEDQYDQKADPKAENTSNIKPHPHVGPDAGQPDSSHGDTDFEEKVRTFIEHNLVIVIVSGTAFIIGLITIICCCCGLCKRGSSSNKYMFNTYGIKSNKTSESERLDYTPDYTADNSFAESVDSSLDESIHDHINGK